MEVGGNKSNDEGQETVDPAVLSDDNINESMEQTQQQDKNNSNVSEIENHSDNTDCSIAKVEENGDRNPEEKLCGWLLHRAKGIGNLKMNRQRWFVYSEENCKLYMYRHPEDLCPVGEFNIDTASFYFDGGNIDKPGIFEIKTDGKDVFLDAGNRHNMMHWLQSLQNKRKMFNLSRGSLDTDATGHWPQKTKKHYGGLIAKETDSETNIRTVFDPGQTVDTIPEIHLTPSETSGSNSSINSVPPSRPLASSLFGLSSIQSALSNIKFPGRTQKEVPQDSSNSANNNPTHVSRDRMSTSSASFNSTDSLVITTEDGSHSLSSGDETKDRTGSQLSVCSDGSDIGVLRNQSGNSKNTGSWTVINNSEAKGAKIEMEKEDYKRNTRSKFYTASEMEGIEEKLERSGSESDSGKMTNFFSSLKKLRIGKRQMSEPGGVSSKTAPPSNGPAQGQRSASNDLDSRLSAVPRSSKGYEDLEDELKANREIVEVLQKQLGVFQKELLARQKAAELDDQGKTNLLMEKEKAESDLNHQLSRLKQEHAATTEKLQHVEEEFASCKEQMAMYEEMLKAKDETIIGLSTQIFDHDHQGPEVTDQSGGVTQPLIDTGPAPASAEKELLRMKDMCQGYELQHKFLTKEILELNELRKMDLAREKKLNIDYAKLEAKYCQVKSKYFVLLKQRKEQIPIRGDVDGQEVVSQLIQDAMETDEDDVELRLTGSVQEYDKYGFSRRNFLFEEEQEVDIDPLSNRAAEFERQSEQLSSQVKDADMEASMRVKWENFMIGRGGKLTRSNELKNLIRLGIPADFRMDVWKGCINIYVGTTREKMDQGFYEGLLQKKKGATKNSDPSVKQIELDLLRTLPNNKHYDDIESVGIIKLRNVLLAYSEYNKHIGYCQGLNRIAAIALLILDEEEAFWCLVAIVEYILPPDYFSSSLMAAQADQRVLKDLVQDKLPKIHGHMERYEVDVSLFAFNWFLTIFVDNIPTETFLRIWDTMLYEGSKVLFRFAVAFLKKCEPEILQQDDGLKLNRFMRGIGQKMTDVKLISHFAFNWINPFPMRFLANRRQFHIQQIKDELLELDKMRHGIKMNRRPEQEEEFYSDDDLDT